MFNSLTTTHQIKLNIWYLFYMSRLYGIFILSFRQMSTDKVYL